MAAETEQAIKVGNILFENPLKENVPGAVVIITVSEKQLAAIAMVFQGFATPAEVSLQKQKEILTFGNNIVNALMPGYINDILEKVLTSGQYQKALKANQSGKILKFSKSGSA